jgi:hypothetical protein
MTRTSFTEQYYEDAEGTLEDPGFEWIILYDFKGIKPSTTFWTNLKRLSKMSDSSLIQYSVFNTTQKRAAVTAKRLAEHYGASTFVFKGNRSEL